MIRVLGTLLLWYIVGVAITTGLNLLTTSDSLAVLLGALGIPASIYLGLRFTYLIWRSKL